MTTATALATAREVSSTPNTQRVANSLSGKRLRVRPGVNQDNVVKLLVSIPSIAFFSVKIQKMELVPGP